MLTALVFAGQCVAYGGWTLLDLQLPAFGAVVVAAAVAIGTGAIATWLLHASDRGMAGRLSDLRQQAVAHEESERQMANWAETQRRLRHDLRGALSPALLTADRLVNHDDPKVRRAGEIMVKSVDRAAALLADPAEASLPGDP